MTTQHHEIQKLMAVLDTELEQMNAVQERITQLKDKIWEMMRDANLSRVCYDGKLTASARGKSLIVSHKRAEIAEE
jgi:hypothetical protein